MSTSNPIQLTVSDVKVIDYGNMRAGFELDTDCRYDGAPTLGEVLFENLIFTSEDAVIDTTKSGSFIETNSPFNTTIKNSVFSVHHDVADGFDVFKLDNAKFCIIDDDHKQFVYFTNNTITFDVLEEGSLTNNFILDYTEVNKRYKEIYITNNRFENMYGAINNFVQVSLVSEGYVYLNDNSVTNCTAHAEIFAVSASEYIIIQNNTFNEIILGESTLLAVDKAMVTTISDLQISKISHFDKENAASLLILSSKPLGEVSLENSAFFLNEIGDTSIFFSSTVGKINFRHNTFTNEIIKSTKNYIIIESPYSMDFSNNTFESVNHDNSSTEATLLIEIKNIDISSAGIFQLQSITSSNCSLLFLLLSDISNHTESLKTISLLNITVKNSEISTLDSIMAIGPFVTEEDISIEIDTLVFTDINYALKGNVIDIRVQTRRPILMSNCYFENIVAGSIRLRPISVATTTPKVQLSISNITALNSDFKLSAFFVLSHYTLLNVTGCTFNRISGYFRGSVVSIIGDNVVASFTSCYFNNNVGVLGGIFYINGKSNIVLHNSKLKGNFALTASVAYISLQGHIEISD